MQQEGDDRTFGTVWIVHLIYLEAYAGASIRCSECNSVLFRGPGESDYHCESCGIVL